MAGTHFRVELEDAAAQQELQGLIDRGQSLQTPFMQVGEYLSDEMWPRRFREKRGPDGLPWAPVTERYAKRKRRGKATQVPSDARTTNPADLLLLTGELSDFPRYQMEGNALVFGVNTKWAAVHQFGFPRRNIPARPYMYLDADDRTEAAAIFRDWIMGT
jgi:hypothetical protein